MQQNLRTKNQKWRRRAIVAALVVGLGGAGSVAAKNYWKGNHFHLLSPAVIESLDLTPQQMTNLEALQARAATARQDMRSSLQTVKDVLKQQRSAQEPDLRAVVDAGEHVLDEMRAEKRQLIEESLELYDTLAPEQKRQLVAALADRFDKMGGPRHHGARHGKHGHQTGWGDRDMIGGKIERLDDAVDLTAPQREAITSLLKTAEPGMQAQRQALRENRSELRTLVQSAEPDQAVINSLAQRQGALVTEMALQRAQLHADIRAQLDQSQREKLNEMKPAGRGRAL